MSEHPVLARLCEAVGMQYANWVVSTDPFECPQPPAYLRKPNRAPWRGIIRAALGRKWARSWRYTMTKSLGRDWPHLGYIEHLRRQHEIIQHGNLCDMFDWLHGKPGYQWIGVNGWDGEPAAENRWVREDASDALLEPTVPWEQARGELELDEATPATGGQSAASCGAKEGRSTEVTRGDR